MGDKRAYFKVDVGYFTNPKIARILGESPTAVVLHLESVAYAAQHLTDGIVPRVLVERLVGADSEDGKILLAEGLWLRTANAAEIEVHDYLEHQRSAAEAKKLSDAGKRAAASRWQSDSDTDGNADGIANAVRNPMPREKEREKEITEAFDAFWAAYPKKTAKGAAVKAYRAATKKVDPALILAGITAQLAWFEAQVKPDGDFRPQASSWLNGERWADELTAPTRKATRPAGLPEGW